MRKKERREEKKKTNLISNYNENVDFPFNLPFSFRNKERRKKRNFSLILMKVKLLTSSSSHELCMRIDISKVVYMLKDVQTIAKCLNSQDRHTMAIVNERKKTTKAENGWTSMIKATT